jgi:serine/threonine protein phosphatase 1
MPYISQLTYAIGDIHGYDAAFERLIERIRNDAEMIGEKPRIVTLGDYVDRGPNSRGVLDRLLKLEQADWCDLAAIKGNHEDAFLQFLENPEYGRTWGMWGGAQTLANYGIDMPGLKASELAWQLASQAFERAVDPARPLAEQGPETFMYMRGRFLKADKACDYVVVHGHTPEDEPVNTDWRIDVDTGIYIQGVLTAVRLRGEERAFLQARPDNWEPYVPRMYA